MSVKQPVSVLVVVHTAALDVLLLERAGSAGLWQSVTGSREGNEDLLSTALREVAEETGIRAAPDSLHAWRLRNRYPIRPEWRHRYASGVGANTEHVFSLCVPPDTAVVLAPGEHQRWCWLPWQKAAAQCFSWSNRDAVLMLPSVLPHLQPHL
ncbi:MAG: dihydroneopterin triphosphate diphosphatase [Proteobacteria bacterium]|nr:dihydroneopterin triphosphate diphosphatase [Pseudomonadota bacterium]HQR04990.1 dihydroneopterin triphosphate diphosphatase [Rhodocyclaceae bacterium]